MAKFPNGIIDLREISAPATPPANSSRLYVKADGILYFKDDAGVERVAGATGTKTSALTAVSSVGSTNELAVNEAGTSKKASISQLTSYLQSVGMPVVRRLNTIHTIASATCTILTDLSVASMAVGTYAFTYYLQAQSSSAAVGLRFALNFTGTATGSWMLSYPSTGTAANTGIADDAGATTGQIQEAMSSKTFATTAGNMGNAGVATINTDIQHQISGVVVVTATGSLDLYHGSSTTTNTSTSVGSSLVLIRTA